jgi:hypothetical protein
VDVVVFMPFTFVFIELMGDFSNLMSCGIGRDVWGNAQVGRDDEWSSWCNGHVDLWCYHYSQVSMGSSSSCTWNHCCICFEEFSGFVMFSKVGWPWVFGIMGEGTLQ